MLEKGYKICNAVGKKNIPMANQSEKHTLFQAKIVKNLFPFF